MIERFKEIECSDDKLFNFHGLDWVASPDHELAIRKYDFEIDDTMKSLIIQSYLQEIKRIKKKTNAEEETIKLFESMIDKPEINYTKVKLPKNLSKSILDIFGITDMVQFGYCGWILTRTINILGDNCEFYFPDVPSPGYAVSPRNEYILLFAPTLGDEFEKINIVEKETQTKFTEQDVW